MNYSTSIIRRLSRNITGRDFVVGDIHGAYTTLEQALRAVRFDPQRDRLLSVGDLIDRGPQSYRCAEFLAKTFVHAVRGNHEDMLIDMHKEGPPDKNTLAWMVQRNGFGWWLTTPAEVQQQILTAVRTLPLVLEVETERGTVGLVHGDVPRGMDWPSFVQALEAGDPEVMQCALWGRERIETGNTEGVLGIDRIFVGHTVQWQGLSRLGNVYAIDTGAIFAEMQQDAGARLTFTNIASQTAVLTAPRLPQLCDVIDAPTTEPFGRYAVDIFAR